MIPIIGIVGGIGSGKSVIAEAFYLAGCGVINADIIAKEVMYCSDVKSSITEIVGEDVYTNDLCGTSRFKVIDRKKFRELILADPTRLDKIQAIIHPIVRQIILEDTTYLKSDVVVTGSRPPRPRAIVWDIPLLIEAGWHTECNALVFVSASKEVRDQRVQNNRKWDTAWMGFLESRQFPIREKQSIVEKFPINCFVSNDKLTEEEARDLVRGFVLPEILRQFQ